jgi:KDO2-lipid IV(A) lauroyltransferase
LPYILYYLILKPLSLLPLSVTYYFSDFTFWIMYRVAGYRKEVVYENIRGSFPNWSEEEVRETMEKFYRFFCDSIVESIRLFSMSEEETIQRCRVTNPELLAEHAAAGRSVILLGGHYANWEIAALSFYRQLLPHITMGVYSPLKNETMDRLIMGNRRRYGTQLVSRRAVQEYFDDQPVGIQADFFVGDQSPSNAAHYKLHWTPFLNRLSGFVMGGERFCVRYDRPAYYMRLRRVSRGMQEATLVPITDHPQETEPGFITEAYVRELEREIQHAPQFWLWTHRRWKRGVPEEVPPLMKGRDYLTGEYDR